MMMKKILFAIALFTLSTTSLMAQNTEIWLVRHAEKDQSNPQDTDPNLSEEGKIRAKDLALYLKKEKFDVAYVTATKRAHQTIDSLIIPKVIEYKDVQGLVDSIKKNYTGKTVMICGHSNTLLDIITAFGAKKPLEDLTEDDYDYIFELSVKEDKAKVKMDHFGRPHRL